MQEAKYTTYVDVQERQNGKVVFTLRDENGDLVSKAAISGITMTLFYLANNETIIINDREQQDVNDVNGGTYYDDLQTTQDDDGDDVTYNFRWDYVPDDQPFLRDDTSAHQTEEHEAQVRFFWNSGAGEVGWKVKFTVFNFRTYPVTSP